MKLAVASLSLVLAACSAPQDPPVPAAPAAPAAPEPSAAPAPDASGTPKRPPGQEDATPLQVFRAFGTEPFWNVNVEDTTLTFTTPDDPDGVVMQGAREALPDGLEITGTHAGQAFALRVAPGECSDGMSDNRYTMTSTFRVGDIDYRGCAEAAK